MRNRRKILVACFFALFMIAGVAIGVALLRKAPAESMLTQANNFFTSKAFAAENVYGLYDVGCDEEIRYLGEDRHNDEGSRLGDWEGNYGSYASILSGMNVTQGGELPIPDGDSTGYDITDNAGFYGSGENVEYSVYTKESGGQDCDMYLRSLETADETQRRAATYYTSGTMNVSLTLPSGDHQLSLYFLDYDSYSFERDQTVTVDDSTTSTPVTQSFTDFHDQGVYKKFAVTSDGSTPIVISISSNVARNAVIAGIFVDTLVTGTPLSYLGEDTTTNGDWKPTYGNNGYLLAAMNNPNDVYDGTVINSGTYSMTGGNRYAWTGFLDHDCDPGGYAYGAKAWMWTMNTDFFGALTGGNSAWTRRATTWDDHSSERLVFDFTIEEEGDYMVTFYATDYDRYLANQHEPRQQILHLFDSEGNEIVTTFPTGEPTYPSSPHQADPTVAAGTRAIGPGVYHTFYVTEGSYRVEVEDFYGNAVLSGVFFDKIECCVYEKQSVDLIAGQNIDAGDVIVTNDEENLYITYSTQYPEHAEEDGWLISETHFHIADSLDGIPQTKKNNPIPGQFDYQYEYSPPISEVTYTLSLADLGYSGGDELYIATHAVVGQWVDGEEPVFETETAWGDGPGFLGKNWAMYFQYTIQDCNGEEPPGPGTESETAFAFGAEDALCFLEIDEDENGEPDFSRWGWTNGALPEGDYTFDVYAGAGQCDLQKGTNVGTLTISYHSGTAQVTYNTVSPYTMSATHLYVGSEMLPQDEGGEYTVAPGQYPYIHDPLADVATDSFTVTGLSGDIYVVAHGVVDGFPIEP